jgi:hypothetical protein
MGQFHEKVGAKLFEMAGSFCFLSLSSGAKKLLTLERFLTVNPPAPSSI